jgi:hypothetical protein
MDIRLDLPNTCTLDRQLEHRIPSDQAAPFNTEAVVLENACRDERRIVQRNPVFSPPLIEIYFQ